MVVKGIKMLRGVQKCKVIQGRYRIDKVAPKYPGVVGSSQAGGILRCQRCTMVHSGANECIASISGIACGCQGYQDVQALARNKGYPMVFKRMQGN